MTVYLVADDFGASPAFNRGILAAHEAGVITAASLMVGEPAWTEAVSLAQLHRIRVGLHVALSAASPVLDPAEIPLLVAADGRFPANESKLHRALLLRSGRRQVRAEVRAQFARFFATGLACYHVNTHRNSYVHPALAMIVFWEARLNDVSHVRIPWDTMRARHVSDPLRFGRGWVLRRMARRVGLHYDDRVIGRTWSAAALLAMLDQLPTHGSTELNFHPVDEADHPFAGDLPALLDPEVIRRVHALRR